MPKARRTARKDSDRPRLGQGEKERLVEALLPWFGTR